MSIQELSALDNMTPFLFIRGKSFLYSVINESYKTILVNSYAIIEIIHDTTWCPSFDKTFICQSRSEKAFHGSGSVEKNVGSSSLRKSDSDMVKIYIFNN